MARRATAADAAPTKSANALVAWDEELAKAAEIAAGMEANAGGGAFFSIKGGVLSFQDAPLPDNQMAVIVLDTIFENVFYEGEYNPQVIVPPTCFAFGREELTLAPHAAVVEHGNDQHNNCKGCPMNEWGTADKGKGKACRNTRRLALIPAGTLTAAGQFRPYDEPEHFEKAALGFFKLPVTSVKGYATFVKQVAGALQRPPYAIFTKVRVVPDPKTQMRVLFEPLAKAPDHLRDVITKRVEEARAVIEFPYNLDVEEKAPVAAKPAARGAKAAPVSARPAVKKKY